jgi:hypothetical protein
MYSSGMQQGKEPFSYSYYATRTEPLHSRASALTVIAPEEAAGQEFSVKWPKARLQAAAEPLSKRFSGCDQTHKPEYPRERECETTSWALYTGFSPEKGTQGAVSRCPTSHHHAQTFPRHDSSSEVGGQTRPHGLHGAGHGGHHRAAARPAL